jgi:hypothetical protein
LCTEFVPLADFNRDVATSSKLGWSVSNEWFLGFHVENHRASDLEFRLLFRFGFGEGGVSKRLASIWVSRFHSIGTP